MLMDPNKLVISIYELYNFINTKQNFTQIENNKFVGHK